jgi:hypothetical protein
MGATALEFSLAHPDPDPGYTAAVERLADLLKRADQLATQQREGMIASRSATSRKKELRQTMKEAHLVHIATIAKIATSELPELDRKFVLPKDTTSYVAFRTAARASEVAARNHKDLLVKHGMSEPLLQGLTDSLAEFDVVDKQGETGRVEHVGASFELNQLAVEVVEAVKAMKGFNRFRFPRQSEMLASWKAASTVFATPHTPDQKTDPAVTPPARADVKPAA